MRARKVRVVFETGDLAGIGGVTVTTELLLYEDGTLTGAGVLLAGDSELAVAATGTYSETIVKRRAAG
jgi:hypothetical protein